MYLVSIPANEGLPTQPEPNVCYRWEPAHQDLTQYYARTNRNLGGLTAEEQQQVRDSVIGVAGCGGMGGLIATTLARLGVGRIRIADSESYDLSNINRQIGATISTIGASKAIETARLMRAVAPDCTIDVFPSGIGNGSVDSFVHGCDLIIDEIDFWSVGSRILLHAAARATGATVLVGSSVGFGTRLFRFCQESAAIEEMLGLTLERALSLEQEVRLPEAIQARASVVDAMLSSIIPRLPDYRISTATSDMAICRRRLIQEGVASIVSTNPPLAAGFLMDQALFILLKRPQAALVPQAPGYLLLDAGQLTLEAVYP